jgi:hypothetical protein
LSCLIAGSVSVLLLIKRPRIHRFREAQKMHFDQLGAKDAYKLINKSFAGAELVEGSPERSRRA